MDLWLVKYRIGFRRPKGHLGSRVLVQGRFRMDIHGSMQACIQKLSMGVRLAIQRPQLAWYNASKAKGKRLQGLRA